MSSSTWHLWIACIVSFASSVCVGSPPAGGTGPDLFNFDGIQAGQRTVRELELHNPSSSAALTVLETESSCSCLRVVGGDTRLPPGGSGKVQVCYKPLKPGRVSLELLIAVQGEKKDMVSFRWSGEVLPRQRGAGPPGADALWISTEELAAALPAKRLTLVDVRDPQRFQQIHVVGSTHLPSPFLPSFAAGRSLVVIDSGIHEPHLLEEVASLRKGGKDVRILRGGMRGWQQRGRAVAGSSKDRSAAGMVTPEEFMRVLEGDWTLMTPAADAEMAGLLEDLGVTVRVLPQMEPGTVRAALESLATEASEETRVMLATGGGENYEELEREMPRKADVPYFYMAGGMRALKLALHVSVAAMHKGPARTVENTGTLKGSLVPHLRTPCGNCPQPRSAPGTAPTPAK